MNRATR